MTVARSVAGNGVKEHVVNGEVAVLSKWIVSGAGVDALSASRIAWRSEPGPLSLVLVTTSVLGCTMSVTVATLEVVEPLLSS